MISQAENNISFDLYHVNFYVKISEMVKKCFDCEKGILELKLNLLDRSTTNF